MVTLSEGLRTFAEGAEAVSGAIRARKSAKDIRESQLGTEERREILARDVRGGKLSGAQALRELEGTPISPVQLLGSLMRQMFQATDPKVRAKIQAQIIKVQRIIQSVKASAARGELKPGEKILSPGKELVRIIRKIDAGEKLTLGDVTFVKLQQQSSSALGSFDITAKEFQTKLTSILKEVPTVSKSAVQEALSPRDRAKQIRKKR